MPVYLRKQEGSPSLQTPSISEFKLDDHDFILDPEILHDSLPQPYRMLDKMVDLVFELSWEQIEAIEAEKARLAAQRRIPKYESPSIVAELKLCTTLRVSPDGAHLFTCVGDSLRVLDAGSQNLVSAWDEERIRVTRIEACAVAGISATAVVTLEHNGVCRLFMFALEKLHLVKILNEPEPGQSSSGSKPVCVDIWIAPESSFVALHSTNEATNASFIDVLKCPREQWMKELDTANQQYQKQVAAGGGASDSGVAAAAAVPSIAFSKPVPVLRARCPQVPTGVNLQPGDLLKKLPPATDQSGPAFGSGQLFPQLTSLHVETGLAAFAHMHAKYVPLLPEGGGGGGLHIHRKPEVMFFTPGRLTPIGLDNPRDAERVCSVGIWWSGLYYMSVYSLLKPPGKDVENKPDSIVNFAGPICASCQSPDNSLVAFGFSDSTVCVHDRQMGFSLLNFRTNRTASAITAMTFLSPALFASDHSDNEEQQQQQSSRSSRLSSRAASNPPQTPPQPRKLVNAILALAEDGTLSRTCFTNDGSNRRQTVYLANTPESEEERITCTLPLPSLPSVIIAMRANGSLTLFDLVRAESMCDLALPAPSRVPSLSAGGNVAPVMGGKLLVVRGVNTEEEYIEPEPAQSEEPPAEPLPPLENAEAYMFALRSFRTLDAHWSPAAAAAAAQPPAIVAEDQVLLEGERFVERASLDQFCRDAFNNRIFDQSETLERMAARWKALKADVSTVRNIRINGIA